MTERSGGESFSQEFAIKRTQENLIKPENQGISNRAIQVAKIMDGLTSADTSVQNDSRDRLNNLFTVFDRQLGNIGVQNIKMVKFVAEDGSGRFNNVQRNYAKEVWNDFVDGTALATVGQVGVDSGIRQAVTAKDATGVERRYVALGGEKLRGLGEVAVKSAVADPRLRQLMTSADRQVAAGMNRGEVAARLAAKISDEHMDGKIDDQEGASVLAYLSERLQKVQQVNNGQELTEASASNEIPTNPESQLRYVRSMLDTLEASNRDTGDYAIANRVHYLESIIHVLSPEVAKEVRARIALVDCYALMRRANGWIEQPPSGGMTIGQAAQVAYERNHDLSREVMEFFFTAIKTADDREIVANGLPIDKAWDWLQVANYEYDEVIDKVAAHFGTDPSRLKKDLTISFDDDPSLGKVETNFYVDGDDERKNLVREFIVEKLGGGYEAKKALQLAERIMYATAETSVINRGSQTGNDQLAEAIGLHAYRRSRAHTGRNRGPEIHIDEIPGFGISWIRQFSRVTNVNTPLLSKDIRPNRIEEGNYLYYYGVWVSAKIHPLREEIMNIAPDPKKMLSRGYFQRAVDYFNKADPPYNVVRVPDRNMLPHEVLSESNGDRYIIYKGRKVVGTRQEDELVFDFGEGVKVVAEKTKEGKKRLRSWYIAGVVQMASTEDSLGWTLDDVQDLGNLVSRERYAELSEEAGTFISKESWNWIMKINNAPSEMRRLEARRRSRARAGRR